MEAERQSDIDFDYIATMITEEHTGVRIETCKNVNTIDVVFFSQYWLPRCDANCSFFFQVMLMLKHRESWAVYSIDFQKKLCIVMDPVETEEPRTEMEAKHRRNAVRVLSNLRRCIHECIPECIPGAAGSALADFSPCLRLPPGAGPPPFLLAPAVHLAEWPPGSAVRPHRHVDPATDTSHIPPATHRICTSLTA